MKVRISFYYIKGNKKTKNKMKSIEKNLKWRYNSVTEKVIKMKGEE